MQQHERGIVKDCFKRLYFSLPHISKRAVANVKHCLSSAKVVFYANESNFGQLEFICACVTRGRAYAKRRLRRCDANGMRAGWCILAARVLAVPSTLSLLLKCTLAVRTLHFTIVVRAAVALLLRRLCGVRFCAMAH